MATRIFLMGTIILFFGVQLRAVDTFVLNEKVTKVINRRIEKKAEKQDDVFSAGMSDPYLAFGQQEKPATLPSKYRITPPRWLGFSFLSIGAVCICTCPLFRSS